MLYATGSSYLGVTQRLDRLVDRQPGPRVAERLAEHRHLRRSERRGVQLFLGEERLPRRGVQEYPSPLHDHDPVAILGGEVHVVGNDDDRLSLVVQPNGEVHDLPGPLEVLAGGGFVQHQDVRMHRHHRRNRHPLLLALAEEEGILVHQVRDLQVLGGVFDAPADLLIGEAHVLGTEGELLLDLHLEDLRVRVLEDVADRQRHLGDRSLARVQTRHGGGPLRGLEQRVEVLDERRLAGPVLAEDSHELAPADLEVHAVQSAGAVLVDVREATDAHDHLVALVLRAAGGRLGGAVQGILVDQGRQHPHGLLDAYGQLLYRPASRAEPGAEEGDLGHAQADRVYVLDVLQHLADRAPVQDLTLIDHYHLVDQVGQFLDLVLHQERGAVLLPGEPGHQIEDLLATYRVDVRGRLVEDEDERLEGQDRRERAGLLLAARQVVRVLAAVMAEAGEVQEPLGSLPDGVDRQSVVAGAEDDLVLHAGVEELGLGVLRQHADDLGERADPQIARVVAPGDGDGSLQPAFELVGDQSVGGPADRRLAGAAGTRDEHDLPLLQGKGHVADDGVPSPVGVGDAVVDERPRSFTVRRAIVPLREGPGHVGRLAVSVSVSGSSRCHGQRHSGATNWGARASTRAGIRK